MSIYYQDELVTLYHGDCLVETAWLDADVLVTDPPYGMAYVSGRVKGRRDVIVNDTETATRDEVLALWGEERPWLMFGTWKQPRPLGTAQVLVWDKTDGVGPGMGSLADAFGTSHEEIYLSPGWRRRNIPRRGSVIRTAVAMQSPNGLVAKSGHPTPKPLGLMATLIAPTEGVVADPFAGSGSTLVAARNLGRKAIGVELEERYCEVIAKRLAQGAFDFGEAS